MNQFAQRLECVSYTQFAQAADAPPQVIPGVAYSRQQIIYDSERIKCEVNQLRYQNEKLKEELEAARMHPLLDDSWDRINISHDVWLKQQRELRRLDEYKTRYYVVVFMLMLILIKFLLPVPFHELFHYC